MGHFATPCDALRIVGKCKPLTDNHLRKSLKTRVFAAKSFAVRNKWLNFELRKNIYAQKTAYMYIYAILSFVRPTRRKALPEVRRPPVRTYIATHRYRVRRHPFLRPHRRVPTEIHLLLRDRRILPVSPNSNAYITNPLASPTIESMA